MVKKAWQNKRTPKKVSSTQDNNKEPQQDYRFDKATYDPRFRDDEDQAPGIDLQDERFNKIFKDEAFTDDCMFSLIFLKLTLLSPLSFERPSFSLLK